jgi:hypothetical protein
MTAGVARSHVFLFDLEFPYRLVIEIIGLTQKRLETLVFP